VQQPDPEAEWWTTSDVAAYIGVAVSTVSTYRMRGQMPAPDQTVGRTHLWQPARIIKWHAGRARSIQRVGADRYRGQWARRETAFTRDHATTWDDPGTRLDRRFETVAVEADLADLLHLETGALVLVRHFVFWAHGEPQQMSRSVLPLELVDGTPIVDPENEPWEGGTIAQMASLGITVTDVEETVQARQPTDEERDTLRIVGGVPVLTITRRMLAHDRPVEAAADIVIPADRAQLRYRMAVADE
jgi:GntR family transcriptional regulator